MLVIMAFLFSLLSVVLVLSHVNFIDHTGGRGVSDMGMLISILGLLITFVVGFQIYNSLESKDTLMEIGELRTVKHELDRFKGEIKAEMNQDMGIFMTSMGEYMAAVFLFMEGLYFSIAIDNENRVDESLRKAIETVDGCDIYQSTDETNRLNTEIARKNAIRWIGKITTEFAGRELFKKNEARIAHITEKLQQMQPAQDKDKK